MKFEIHKVEYDGSKTMPVFDEVYYEDDLLRLQKVVEEESANRRGRIVKVDNDTIPFKVQNPEGIEIWVKYIYPIPKDETKVLTKEALEEKGYIAKDKQLSLRPYKSVQEILDVAYNVTKNNIPKNARPLLWVRHKNTGNVFLITAYCENGVMLDEFYDFEELFKFFEYIDGSPCGVHEYI